MTTESMTQEECILIERDGPIVPLASRLIYIFESASERARFASFIALGLAEQDKCIIATDPEGKELFSEALIRLGVDLEKYEGDNSLVFIMDDISVETLEPIARPIFEYERARFRFIRLINDTGYKSGVTTRDFLHLEGSGHLLIRRQPCTTICQYDTNKIERSHLHHIIAAHQFTILADSAKSRLEENPDRRPFTQIIFDGMDEQLRALTRLQGLSLKLTASLDLNETLDALIEAAMTICRADRAAVSCINEKGELAILGHRGLSEDYINRRQVKLDNPSVANMIVTRQPVIIEDVDLTASDSPNYQAWKSEGIRSVVRLPLVSEGEVFGVISAASGESRRYTQTEVDAMAILAAQASAAVTNARLFERLREANQAKDDFLATLSHEMRTPLTPILGWIHILKPFSATDPLLAEGLESIERNARRQSVLINHLLDLTRIISGKTELFRQPTDLNILIQSATDEIRPQTAEAGLTIDLSLPADPIMAYVDPLRIQQIASNLLDNALKFTPEGGRVWVSLSREPHSGDVIIEVADNGAGIEREFLPRVFDRFTQAHVGINRTYGGLGLGLAISRAMVELHGGEITATSEGANRGSRFTVRLPGESAVGEKKQSAMPALGGGAFERLGLQVLLVEDSTDALNMMEMWLNSFGCEVRTATRAVDALQLAAEQRPDLIISDIGLPEIDGHALMRELRKMPGLEKTPAIALSGYTLEEDEEIAFAAGYDAHLAKPAEMNKLLRMIKDLTGK